MTLDIPLCIIVFWIFLEQQLEKDATGCDLLVCTLLHIYVQVHCANVIHKSCNDFNNLDSCEVELYIYISLLAAEA
jgi:hypothetical protein